MGMYPPAPVAYSEWVCGTLCHRSPLPWSCRRWWVGCIYFWLGLDDPPAPVVLFSKWPTWWCHQRSEGSWLFFIVQFVVHIEIHWRSSSSPSPLGYWTSSTEKGQLYWTLHETIPIVPATLTLASCFLYSLASKSVKCRGYPMSIIVTQPELIILQMVSWMPSWSPQSTYRMVAGTRVPFALVFRDSWFVLLSPFLVGIPPVCLQFLFRSSLRSCSVCCILLMALVYVPNVEILVKICMPSAAFWEKD